MRRCVSMAATLALARVAAVGGADLQLKLGGPVELKALTAKGASICGIPACPDVSQVAPYFFQHITFLEVRAS